MSMKSVFIFQNLSLFFNMRLFFWISILFVIFLLLIFSGCAPHTEGVAEPGSGETDIIPEENGIKVLFIGNSLTFGNDMPGIFKNLSLASSRDMVVDQVTIGGASLAGLLRDKGVIEKIKQKNWDYIVLQSNDITAFPALYNKEIQTLNQFKDGILSTNKSAKIIYLMVWGFKNSNIVEQKYGFFENEFLSYEEYQQNIQDGTVLIAKTLDIIAAPVGLAWLEVRHERPEIELYGPDLVHPAYPGSYLCACIYYVAIFREGITNNSYFGNLSEEVAGYLQIKATAIVLENLARWNIKID